MSLVVADTNFCLRLIDKLSPAYQVCEDVLNRLDGAGHSIGIPLQVLVEFWVVATRPKSANGLEWTPARTDSELTRLEQCFVILPEDPDTFLNWRQLVNTHSIKGKRTHDARIAASMLTYGVAYILTFNGNDFRTFPHLTVLDPSDIASGAIMP
jgi:predicted nucleic acid-binding protein